MIVRSKILSKTLSSRGIHEAVNQIRRRGAHQYEINLPLLKRLKPDLVITQELCGVCAASHPEVLEAIGCLSPKPKAISVSAGCVQELFDAIETLGRATGHGEQAMKLNRRLKREWSQVERRADSIKIKPKVWCAEWLDPLMVSGHWIPEMVAAAGGVDGLGKAGKDSRRVEWDEVFRYNPDVILVMPCSFSMERTRNEISLLTRLSGWKKSSAVKGKRVFVVEGSFFHRAGPRLIEGLKIMAGLFHPGFFPRPSERHAEAL